MQCPFAHIFSRSLQVSHVLFLFECSRMQPTSLTTCGDLWRARENSPVTEKIDWNQMHTTWVQRAFSTSVRGQLRMWSGRCMLAVLMPVSNTNYMCAIQAGTFIFNQCSSGEVEEERHACTAFACVRKADGRIFLLSEGCRQHTKPLQRENICASVHKWFMTALSFGFCRMQCQR